MLGGGKLIHAPKCGTEVFVVAIALYEARELGDSPESKST
jgi:hypothetical protein